MTVYKVYHRAITHEPRSRSPKFIVLAFVVEEIPFILNFESVCVDKCVFWGHKHPAYYENKRSEQQAVTCSSLGF